ncbi:hypothetical protein KL910_003543 [Ogataea haglerorum]|nr:hypothetical protein KL910_003543 [Ogataea haglerorum]KAG7790038.1 hypothetical protein KL945_001576 [Ogataea haglerorum]
MRSATVKTLRGIRYRNPDQRRHLYWMLESALYSYFGYARYDTAFPNVWALRRRRMTPDSLIYLLDSRFKTLLAL